MRSGGCSECGSAAASTKGPSCCCGGGRWGAGLMRWGRAVAPAILAGVIAQILVSPPGALASVPDWLRYGAVASGFAAFLATRRSTFAGVACGEGVMLAGKWWLGG